MLEFGFNLLVTLLVVVDPLELAPIFAVLARGYLEKRKREAAFQGTLRRPAGIGGLYSLPWLAIP